MAQLKNISRNVDEKQDSPPVNENKPQLVETEGLVVGPRMQFGRWTTIKRDKGQYWLCRCSCGNMGTPTKYHLLRGNSQSCGCIEKENPNSRKHGGHEWPEYYVWCGMRRRCQNPKDANFVRYGQRGIKVCPQWQDFGCFIKDMGRRPTPKHSIERVDNAGNYCPENCKWATRTEQNNNTRRNVWVNWKGERMTLSKLAQMFNMHVETLWKRIFIRHWSIEKSVYANCKRLHS